MLPIAAAAALVVCGCAAEDPALRQELASLKAEVRTLQRENAEVSRKVDALGSRVDLLAARPAHPPAPPAPSPLPAAPSPQPAAAAAPGALVDSLVPAGLKVVRLEPDAQPAKAAKAGKAARPQARAAPSPPGGSPPPLSTATPVREPDQGTVTSLEAGGKDLAAEAQAALAAAKAQTGLPRARALEQFTARYPGYRGAQEALVAAARTRAEGGDPDGACEDYARAVKDYPAGNAMPDALAGLAGCEARSGRTAEAKRLEERLAQDYPDSPAAKRAPPRAPAAQGAVP